MGAGIVPFLAVQIPAALAALVATVALVRGSVSVAPAFERAEWVPLLRSVLPFAAATIIAAVYFRAALLVLWTIVFPLHLATAVRRGYEHLPRSQKRLPLI